MSAVHLTYHSHPLEGIVTFPLPLENQTVVAHIPAGYKLRIVTAYSQDAEGEDKFLIALTRKSTDVQED